MMRGISTWAVAVRKPSAEQIAAGGPDLERGGQGRDRGLLRAAGVLVQAPPRAALADHPRRHRAGRVAQDRLQGARHLRQRADAGGRAGREAGDRRRRLGRHDHLRDAVRGRPVLPAAGRPDEPVLGLDPERGRVRGDREADPDLDLPALPVADLADEGPAARVPVPRRRAQDDLLLRGRGAADAGERQGVLALPPALRHELPAAGDDRRHLRLRPASASSTGSGCSSRGSSASRSSRASPSS